MQLNNLNKVLGITAASICTIFAAGQSAQAFSFTKLNTDWRIVQDSFSDGTGGGTVGASTNFEMFGMAAKVENGQAYFAFNGNLALEKSGVIGQGDLFLNFTGKSFKDASAQEKLFAVHFASNDAGDGSMADGLYKDVRAKSVTSSNSGHSGFQSYRNYVGNKGGNVEFGDLTDQEALEYLAQETTTKQVRKTIEVPETYTEKVKVFDEEGNPVMVPKMVHKKEKDPITGKKVKVFDEEGKPVMVRKMVWKRDANGKIVRENGKKVKVPQMVQKEVEEERTRMVEKKVWVDETALRNTDGNHSIQNVIDTGTKVANDGFSLLSGAELEEIKALDFGTNDPAIYSKAKTFGFKFDAS
ncbi:MAG: XDD3 family exosortase-dependent surface protein, partial [Trichodesmium sp.]